MAWDATLRIEPRRPPATITRAAAWAQKNPPLRLTSRTKSRVGNDLGDQRLGGERDVGARAGQGDRDASPDPLRGTRDEGDLALEPCHASSPARITVRTTPSNAPAPPIEPTPPPRPAVPPR